jgi:hypothetical protein
MSKRKSRKQKAPNLPEETLARARQQAGLAAIDDDDQSEEIEEVVEVVRPKATAPAHNETRSAEAEVRASQRKRRRAELGRRDKDKPLTSTEIAELLEHPVKTVTEEELKAQYGYVLADLRSMALLSVGLIAVLVVLAQFL